MPRSVQSLNLFYFACLFESGLMLVAIMFGLWMDLNWWSGLKDLSWRFVLYSLLAVIPMFGFFTQMLCSDWRPFMEVRFFLDDHLRPMFRSWTWWQYLILSFCAGWGEETLFRGVIQAWLTESLGTIPALIVSGLLFGLLHSMTTAYFVIATLIGIYLGSLWILTQSLWVPILAHAFYDFIAIYYFMRCVPEKEH